VDAYTFSQPSTSLCLHPSLQPLASSLGRVPYSIQCLDCHKLVTLSSLSTTTEDNQIQFEHQFHNPRTNFPPPSSTTKDPCPHPQCSEIPFPHDNHMLMITSSPPNPNISPCRFTNSIPKDLKGPTVPEIKKFLTLMRGCKKKTCERRLDKEHAKLGSLYPS
jgi:hypothetical protein